MSDKSTPNYLFAPDPPSFPEVFAQNQELRQKYRSQQGQGGSKKSFISVHMNTFLCTA